MAQEIELKFRLDDPQALRNRLRESRARLAAHRFEVNRIFDTPDRRLLSGDCGLRIRESRPVQGIGRSKPTLTFKGPRQSREAKSREELATTVADAEDAATILARLGFNEVITYEKRRELWRLDDCEVCLDELPRLGWFVEIEGPNTAALESIRSQLGLTDTPALRETYVELAADHGDTDAHDRRQLRFES